jgi:DNA repair ATPase RecN
MADLEISKKISKLTKVDRIHIMIKRQLKSYSESETSFEKKMIDYYEKNLALFYSMIKDFGGIVDELLDQVDEAEAGFQDNLNHPHDDNEKMESEYDEMQKQKNPSVSNQSVIDLTLPDATDPDFVQDKKRRIISLG